MITLVLFLVITSVSLGAYIFLVAGEIKYWNKLLKEKSVHLLPPSERIKITEKAMELAYIEQELEKELGIESEGLNIAKWYDTLREQHGEKRNL